MGRTRRLEFEGEYGMVGGVLQMEHTILDFWRGRYSWNRMNERGWFMEAIDADKWNENERRGSVR